MKKICILWMMALVLFSCKKIGEPQMPVVDVNVTTTSNTAVIKGVYEHNMTPDNIILIYAETSDMTSSVSKEMNVQGHEFDITLTELDTNVEYFFKLRFVGAYNFYETEQQTFVTTTDDSGEDPVDPDLPDAVELPMVVVETIDDITQTSAILKAVVVDDGGADVTSRGFCWSVSQEPTIDDYSVNVGHGIGEYDNIISDLLPDTRYYVRAFAENVVGISYSHQDSFKTLEADSPVNTTTITVNEVSFVMVEVEGGTFTMGSSDVGSNIDETPEHEVTLSTYFIGETEVTQKLWMEVMNDNPSYNVGEDKPVDNVSWENAMAFIELLNYMTGKRFRLPTEAEWEYAARGGNRSNSCKYSGSNSIGNVAWYQNNSNNETKDVKTKLPNELGIYDMSGNVLEWCSDWYGGYVYNPQINPTGPESGDRKIVRGGSFSSEDSYCRVADRSNKNPSSCDENNGLRIIMEK